MKRQFIIMVVALAALTAGALLASHTRKVEPPVQARILQTPRPLPDFALTDHRGEPFGPSAIAGRWVFLFFGFTHCPDICPTTLHTLARTMPLLEDLPATEQPGVVLVSVDPMRDDPEQLAGYVPYFDSSFAGATGEMGDLKELATTVGAAFSFLPVDETYTVEHTASLFLIDPEGRLSAVFTTPHSADGIARDYRRVLDIREQTS